jgi:hypothetical protein
MMIYDFLADHGILSVWIVGFRYFYPHERIMENQGTTYKQERSWSSPLNPTYVHQT